MGVRDYRYKCPKCGAPMDRENGWHCSAHCGMNVRYICGTELNDSIITNLLYAHEHPECRRRFIKVNINGTKCQVYPIVDEVTKGDETEYCWTHYVLLEDF